MVTKATTTRLPFWLIVFAAALALAGQSHAQQSGSIRGVVYDQEFEAPMANPEVLIVETGATATGTEDGSYVFNDVAPGQYTLVFSKSGYARQVKSDVVVTPGQLTDVDAWLTGEFTDMEEFVVQDLQIGGATEIGLLNLRAESPALIDSISADLMSQAGASDAASALSLVSGATVQDGKFAVIRGLPDRYVNSQINGVRLPTADEDKRAAQLDQFPSAVIESIQVSKTFTPDQQGDASGGAVNVVLKGVPDETFFEVKAQTSYNSQVSDRDDFLSYDGGGINFWADEDGDRNIPFDGMFDGAVGTSRIDSPTDYKWSIAGGVSHESDTGVRIGGFASLFYERDSSFYRNGVDDQLQVENPGDPLTPAKVQDQGGDFKTALFDVTQATQSIQWGALAAAGIETENHSLSVSYLFTRIAEDTATLAEDTRGKEFFFPGYDPDDPFAEGNNADNTDVAPYIRNQTLQYEERTTETLLFHGEHTLQFDMFGKEGVFQLLPPEVDWTIAKGSATLYQPDKRQFGARWFAPSFRPGVPFLGIPDEITDPLYRPFRPAANATLGNFQRIWKEIEEDSTQFALNLKFPFEQWTGDEGYFKFGTYFDETTRNFDQDTFSNFNDGASSYVGGFDELWSDVFEEEIANGLHPITEAFVDVDYRGEQDISAFYAMVDVPLNSKFNVIGGARFEKTNLSIVNDPEVDSVWFPPGEVAPVTINPGDTDVEYEQEDILPSIGFVYTPFESITLRGSYTETVARQTFKELTPIQQQEFLGGDVFIGNPDLRMSALRNFDLRLDYEPYEGGLFSVSYFTKDITDPIENVQRVAGFTFTTPVNYPEGELSGFELEMRQDLGQIWEPLSGLSIGANATFIDAEVTLPDAEAEIFADRLEVPMTTRDMTNAPEYLYNLYLTYDLERTGTQFAVFYTVKGDTLITGAGESDGNFIPSVYAAEFGTLNMSLTQRIGEHFKVKLQAKNLTNPTIRTVYRSDAIERDRTRTSFTRGIDYSIGVSAEFRF